MFFLRFALAACFFSTVSLFCCLASSAWLHCAQVMGVSSSSWVYSHSWMIYTWKIPSKLGWCLGVPSIYGNLHFFPEFPCLASSKATGCVNTCCVQSKIDVLPRGWNHGRISRECLWFSRPKLAIKLLEYGNLPTGWILDSYLKPLSDEVMSWIVSTTCKWQERVRTLLQFRNIPIDSLST